MTDPAFEADRSERGAVEDVLDPGAAAGATGDKVAAYSRPVAYRGWQREDTRHVWTLEPDDAGRFHAVTLSRREPDGAWEATADQPYSSLGEAQSWATELFRSTQDPTTG
ncbi:MAG TPA: hypothetical protein VHK06_07815 [Candidatus Limnocylindria bacterium]|nr:hypothetical protein [Candidatus Limnocylindria bacterium]